jgi:cytosine/adenosine deaminase-related metal-dependent hydrolase
MFVQEYQTTYNQGMRYRPTAVAAVPERSRDVPYMQAALTDLIDIAGGFVNAHAHFDRAYTLTPDRLALTGAPMQEKWVLNNELKRTSSVADYVARIERAVQTMQRQGVRECMTFIDVDPLSGMRALEAAKIVQARYARDIKMQIANQTLGGVMEPAARRLFDAALEQVDIIGGLPSRDAGHEAEHLDVLLSAARRTGKAVHVHVDQINSPHERETELLARKVIEHGVEGQVVAVHSISLSAHETDYRRETYRLMREANLTVVVCPSAALSMKMLPYNAPLHNAIAPVPELLEAGINVAIGTDNISDIYCPMNDGDLYTELRVLADACRMYDVSALVKIATAKVPGIRG